MTPNTRDRDELREALKRLASWDELAGNGDPDEFPAMYREEIAARISLARAALNAVPPEPLDGEATAAALDPDAETMPLGEVARRFPLSVASAHEADPQVEHDCRAGCFSGGCGPCWTTGCGHHGRHALQTPRADR